MFTSYVSANMIYCFKCRCALQFCCFWLSCLGAINQSSQEGYFGRLQLTTTFHHKSRNASSHLASWTNWEGTGKQSCWNMSACFEILSCQLSMTNLMTVLHAPSALSEDQHALSLGAQIRQCGLVGPGHLQSDHKSALTVHELALLWSLFQWFSPMFWGEHSTALALACHRWPLR